MRVSLVRFDSVRASRTCDFERLQVVLPSIGVAVGVVTEMCRTVLIAETFNMTYEMNGDQVIFMGEGCQ